MIAVLDYGIGNLRSAEKALQHVGADARLVSDPSAAAGADGVVLPGVGNFGRCMSALRDSGLDRAALDAIASGTPFLGICVGMQMLYEGSEESPGVPGLGVLEGAVGRLSGGVKHPQMQWNTLHLLNARHPLVAGLGPEPWMYFVHSYAPRWEPGLDGPGRGGAGLVVATCDYGAPVIAAVARGPVWATQFHPEKSGASGLRMLANFAAAVARAAGVAGAPEA